VPVDFSLLPPEDSVPEPAPSRRVWGIVFVVMVLVGMIAVLLLWPDGAETRPWKFWTSMILFPVGVSMWIVLRRYSVHEGRKLDADLYNEAARRYRERVFEVASIPLAVMGAAYRFTADKEANAVGGIRSGTVKLMTQEPIARNAEPVRARWLAVPGMKSEPGKKEEDLVRQQQVTQWLFAELLDALVPRIQRLPDRSDLVVHLGISNALTARENEALWWECWYGRELRRATVVSPADGWADLMALDAWMDQEAVQQGRQARLYVFVQLHALLSRTPPAGASEAGVALLLVPDAFASRHQLPRVANLHRPVRGSVDQSNTALANALKWGGVGASEIAGGWQTGLDAKQAGALREAAVRLGLNTPATDLDQTVGHAGMAACWLAIACAAASLSPAVRSQVVLAGIAGKAESVDCAVLRNTGPP